MKHVRLLTLIPLLVLCSALSGSPTDIVLPGITVTAQTNGSQPDSGERIDLTKRITTLQMLLVGVNLAFAFLHLLLFWFYRQIRSNLYYAGLTASAAMNIYCALGIYLAETSQQVTLFQQLTGVTTILFALFWLRFVYSLTDSKLPKQFYPFLLVGAGMSFWVWQNPKSVFLPDLMFISVAMAEIARALILARLHRRPEMMESGWLIGVGTIPLILGSGYQILVAYGVLPLFWNFFDFPAPFYGQLGLTISMSVYLALYVARVNRNLSAQSIQRIQLEQENARKSKELEDARLLQLSMLPQEIPPVNYLDIAVHMQTATEVGGDYYDFKFAPDGSFLVFVGDATGHGMQAGTMIAATKSVLNSLTKECELVNILKRASYALKEMGFQKMYMALTIARFSSGKVEMASAGMPFPLVYRAATRAVEQFELKGMPLGSVPDFPFQSAESKLAKGDTVLLMSDGFPELFNSDKEILGYHNVNAYFKEIAARQSAEIVQALIKTGEEWSGGQPPNDDVTFVVVKQR